MTSRQRPAFFKHLPVRMFQISGISLFTVSVLNMLFLKSIGILVNLGLIVCALVLLAISFWLWQRLGRVPRRRARY